MVDTSPVLAAVESYALAYADEKYGPQLASLQARNGDLEAQVQTLTSEVADLEHRLDVALHPAEELIRLDLSKVPLGALTAAGAAAMLGQTTKLANDAFWRFHTVVQDPDGRRWLRWSTKAGTEGSAYGISLGVLLSKRVDRCSLNYTLRFSSGFEWALGEKLWGVSATTGPDVSPTLASGNKDPGSAGASSRVMLLAQKAFPTALKGLVNSFSLYWYAPGKTEQNIFTKREVKAGVPVDLVLEQAMNAVGKADGLASLTVDGDELVRNEGMLWRTDARSQWSHLFPNMFRGGPNNDPNWAASTDGYIDIADGLTVTTPTT